MYVKNKGFWYATFEILWITIVALLANFIFELKLDFNPNNLDIYLVLKFILLIFSIIFYGVFFFSYKNIYDKAKDLELQNFILYEDAIRQKVELPKRLTLNDCFVSVRNQENIKYWGLVFSLIFLLSYTIKWDNWL